MHTQSCLAVAGGTKWEKLLGIVACDDGVSWYVGMLVCWYVGVSWYAGMLVCVGMLVSWYAGVSWYTFVCWCVGMLVCELVCWYRDWETDRKSTRLNSSHRSLSRMPSSA